MNHKQQHSDAMQEAMPNCKNVKSVHGAALINKRANIGKHFAVWAALFLVALIIGGLISVLLKQDANWDLKNYHLYAPWAYLNHRLKVDLFAAGIQSYFPPLLDVPYFLLATRWLPNSPRFVAFIMGLPYGMLLFIAFWISWLVTGDYEKKGPRRALLSILALTFGATGVATVSQVGTTFDEIPVAALTLLGLATALLAYGDSSKSWSRNRTTLVILLAGILFGAAAGLKLTACIYAPGGALLIFLRSVKWREKFNHTILFCLGWMISFLAIWGPWGLKLFRLTGNPFFPLFNSIFRSPWIAPSGGLDARFFPKSVLEALFYPFYWANNSSMTVMEPHFVDYRFAVVYATGLLAFVLWLRATWKSDVKMPLAPVSRALLIFVMISFVIWESVFSILRYAATLEVLLGAVLLTFLVKIFSHMRLTRFDLLAGTLGFAVIGVALSTCYPVWGRVDYSKQVFDIESPRVPSGSLVILISKPLAYVVPFIAPPSNDFKVIGITGKTLDSQGYLLSKMVRNTIEKWRGPIYFIIRKETAYVAPDLSRFGVYPTGRCSPITSNIDESLLICLAGRKDIGVPWPEIGKPKNYVLGVKLVTNSQGYSLNSFGSGWSSPEAWGTWSDAGQATIVIHSSEMSDKALKLSFFAHAFLVPRHPKLAVSISVNGTVLHKIDYIYPTGTNEAERDVTIPAAVVAAGKGMLKIQFNMDKPASPASVGLSADPRLLGLGMVWLKISTMK